jgi:hypothetical protein
VLPLHMLYGVVFHTCEPLQDLAGVVWGGVAER